MSVPAPLNALLHQCRVAARAHCPRALALRLDAAVEGLRARAPDTDATDEVLAALGAVQQSMAHAGVEPGAAPLRECLLGVAAWMLERHLPLRTLAPVVDALAGVAGAVRDPDELGELASFAARLIDGTDDGTKVDPAGTNPGHPWYVLHCNRAILATRSLDPATIELAYDALARALPRAAPGFFAEAMSEMVRLDYPPRVRAVVERYYDALSRGLRQ